jgi:hypothetical protein
MAVPAVVQVSPIVSGVIYSTARTVTFASPVTAGSTIVLCGFVANEAAASVAAVTASVAMTGEVFIRRGDAEIRYPGTDSRGITLWQADDADGGETAITVTPSLANALNFCSLVAIEISGCHAETPYETLVSADTENGVFSIALGPAPASGSLSQADTMALALIFINQSNNASDPGWQTPSGWTAQASSLLSSGAQRPIWLGTKTQTTTTAVSVTASTTEADLYGRVGFLLVLRGTTGSPAPPPPTPTPTPPPPGPGPAPSPPPPGPSPAPVSQGFEFINADPDIAGEGGVVIQIHAEPTTQQLLGTFIQSEDGQEWVANGSTSKLVVEHDGVVTVTTGQTVVAVAQNASNTAGIRGVMEGLVVDL